MKRSKPQFGGQKPMGGVPRSQILAQAKRDGTPVSERTINQSIKKWSKNNQVKR